jgi:hypothetical protein
MSQDPKLQYLDPDLLDFDPQNPRFGGLASGKNQAEIQKYLFGEPHYAGQLIDSLVENGFIDYEPLVAKHKVNRFTLVEGNRRLAAIREIRSNPDKYGGRKSDLSRIPVLVFPDRPDEQQQNEMRVYLGVRHLFGFREWPPMSKAQFLDQESRAVGGLDRVIKEVRLTKSTVRRFLVPFRLLKEAKIDLPKGGEDFSVLAEALQRTGIKRFLQLDVDPKTLEILSFDKKNLNTLLSDLYGPKKPGGKDRDTSAKIVFDTRDLSRLARVLDSDTATATLHSGASLDEAEILVDTREESVKRLAKVTKEIGAILKKLKSAKKEKETANLAAKYQQFEIAVKAFVTKDAKPSL